MSDKFDDIINDAFTNSESEAAPKMAWNHINDELQNITELDDKVKQSFEATTEKAPDFVWEKVQDQLDIDRVWQKISARLLISNVKRTYLGYACSLLFLLLPFVLDYSNYRDLKGERPEPLTVLVSQKESNLNTVEALDQIETKRNVQTEFQAKRTSKDVLEVTPPFVDVHTIDSKNNGDSKHLKAHALPLRPISLVSLPIESDLAKWNAPFSPKPKRRWIGGLTVSLDHTWILDRDTRAGFDDESLVENKFSIGNSAGLFFEFPIRQRFALHGEYLFQCVTRQANQSYINGTYTLKEKEIKAHRMVLLASYNSKARHNWITHSNAFRFGTFLSVITRNSIEHNGTLVELNSLSNRMDFGIQSEIGKRVYFRSFIFEAGVRADYGLLNLANSTSEIPKHLNFTREASVGGYLKVGYYF